MQRVLVLGCSGTGKSVLARRLGERTGLPVIHLDQHYWFQGWTALDGPSWRARVAELTAQPAWIMDGNHPHSLPRRLAVADTVILLDLPAWRCLARVLRRQIRFYGRVRPDMAAGCPERFDWDFMHYIWNFRKQRLPSIRAALETFEGRTVLLKSSREIAGFNG